MKKIRTGDEVIVTAGKDKGKRGNVLALDGEYVTVEGLNLAKKHVKPNPMKGTTGGVESKSMPPAYFERVARRRERQGVARWHQGRGRQEGPLSENDRCDP